jgi:DNA-binding YbaB/EbfC family protein
MSKGKARPGGGFRPGGGLPGMPGGAGGMMAQLQKLQDEMARTQEKLAEETVEVTVGGGMIAAVMNGHQKLLSITIAKDAVDPEDVEMLQDMIVAAVNEAIERSQGLAADKMSALTGGLKIPGLM